MNDRASSCVLLVGGTFDPPHRAHVEIAAAVAANLGAERIVFIPAGRNPLKSTGPVAGDADRLAMLRLAIEPLEHADISTLELERDGPSYFVDTLAALRATSMPRADVRFLIGADQAVEFHRWFAWPRILRLASPAVVLREPWDEATFIAEMRARGWDDRRWRDWIVPLELRPHNATDLRDALAAGSDDPAGWMDEKVLAYIREHGLYGAQ